MPIALSFRLLELQKLYPLRISRGSMSGSANLFVFAHDTDDGEDGPVGIGELGPATGSIWNSTRGQKQLEELAENYEIENPTDTWKMMYDVGIDPPAIAALDIALWDLLAKQLDVPLYRMLGLSNRVAPTSVTVGLNEPSVTSERTADILRRTGAKKLKIKLGSPDGLEADQEHFLAAWEASQPFHASLQVDANGGWNVTQARKMMTWLAQHDVQYVEQPLAEGEEEGLKELYAYRKLPIFVDESVRFASDVPALADRVDGINLKLMKCGGITEAVRIVATARACGLRTMIGCMSETSISIAAGAAIGSLFDYVDLDSHLNLNPDPAVGAEIIDGIVAPSEAAGHGAHLKPEIT